MSEVTVTRDDIAGMFTISLEGECVVGKSLFVDSATQPGSRIFYHTEIDPAFGGRGLAGKLVSATLSDTQAAGLTVVPVCPFYVKYLAKSGDEFEAQGGHFREASKDEKTQAMTLFKESQK